MTINFAIPQPDVDLKPRITVIGVGGAGGNAVNNMIESRLEGVEFVVANTDAQALLQSRSERKIQLGHNITHGLGAGARPDIGRAAAEEAIDELVTHLHGAHMAFITAGMGGGTGTGAAPVIARLAREHGILTVGVVTKPFQFEGINRLRIAEAGIEEMQQYVDTLIVIPNQNLFRLANEKTTFADAFAMADEVLHSGVRGVTDLMVVPGLINLDFADIRTVMSEMGKAMMGTGEAEGDDRARLAAEAAISNPLLDEVSMKGARGVLINITGGPDITLFEVDEAANRIGDEVDSEANIIFGSTMDPTMEGRLRVSVVATGIDAEQAAQPRPVLKVYSSAQPHGQPVPRRDEPTAHGMVDIPSRPVPPTTIERSRGETVPSPADVGSDAVDDQLEIAEYGRSNGSAGMPGGSMATEEEALFYEQAVPAVPPTQPRFGLEAPPRTGRAAETFPDPFRNGPPETAQSSLVERGLGSLFQRFTGVDRGRKVKEPVAPSHPPTPPRPQPKAPPKLIDPMSRPRPEPAMEPPQTKLDAAVKRETKRAPQSEEDLLDIPAFLRRQAN